MGDRSANIDVACDLLEQMGVKIVRTSSLWETSPMYVLDQDKFLNAALQIETSLEPLDLLHLVQSIENAMGRVKLVDKGPRIIDLDIIKYEGEVVKTDALTLPHPLAHEREFVLRPLAELCPSEPLHPSTPWKLVVDYLEALPPSKSPLSTVTPITSSLSLRALDPHRKTHIMGIINMTPDSFSGDGIGANTKLFFHPHSAVYNFRLSIRFQHLIRSGATILDIGGQSTRPNAPYIPGEEEKNRVLPAIRVAAGLPEVKSGQVAISVDTFSSSVGMAAIEKGASLVNDVSAGTLSGDRILHVAARKKKTIALMHMRGNPATMGKLNKYTSPHDPLRQGNSNDTSDFQDEDAMIYSVAVELLARIDAAQKAGVRRWHIILDPGLGFAKVGVHQNMALLRRLPELREWPGLQGLPWMVGPSRKSFLAPFVQKQEIPYQHRRNEVPRYHERIFATAAAVSACVEAGADIIRVHDVRAMAEVAAVSDAMWRATIVPPRPYVPPLHQGGIEGERVLDAPSTSDSEKESPNASAELGERETDVATVHEKQSEENPADSRPRKQKSLDSVPSTQPVWETKAKQASYDYREWRRLQHKVQSVEAAEKLLDAVRRDGGDISEIVPRHPSWRSVKRQLARLYGVDNRDRRTRWLYGLGLWTSSPTPGQPKSEVKDRQVFPWRKLNDVYLRLVGKETRQLGNQDPRKDQMQIMVSKAMKEPTRSMKRIILMSAQRLARTNLFQRQRLKILHQLRSKLRRRACMVPNRPRQAGSGPITKKENISRRQTKTAQMVPDKILKIWNKVSRIINNRAHPSRRAELRTWLRLRRMRLTANSRETRQQVIREMYEIWRKSPAVSLAKRKGTTHTSQATRLVNIAQSTAEIAKIIGMTGINAALVRNVWSKYKVFRKHPTSPQTRTRIIHRILKLSPRTGQVPQEDAGVSTAWLKLQDIWNRPKTAPWVVKPVVAAGTKLRLGSIRKTTVTEIDEMISKVLEGSAMMRNDQGGNASRTPTQAKRTSPESFQVTKKVEFLESGSTQLHIATDHRQRHAASSPPKPNEAAITALSTLSSAAPQKHAGEHQASFGTKPGQTRNLNGNRAGALAPTAARAPATSAASDGHTTVGGADFIVSVTGTTRTLAVPAAKLHDRSDDPIMPERSKGPECKEIVETIPTAMRRQWVVRKILL